MFDCIYLHIGLDKTGSKAIQFACCENAKALLNAGIFYPVTPDTVWHAEFASFFHENPMVYDYNRAIGRSQKKLAVIQSEDRRYIRNLEQKIQQIDGKNMVLSYEGFAALDEDTLRKIQAYLMGISKQVKVMLYCREPVSYACSAVSQRAKSMIPLWENVPIQNYKAICEKFITYFGRENMIVRDFSADKLDQRDVRADFFQQIGLSHACIESFKLTTSGENRSLCSEAISIAIALRKRCQKEQIPEAEFSWRYSPILEKIKGHPFSLSTIQRAEVNELAKNHLNYLKSQFSIDFTLNLAAKTVDAPVFSENFLESMADIICYPTEFTAPLVPEVKTDVELACKPFIGKLHCSTEISTVVAGEKFSLLVDVSNQSDFHWLLKGITPTYLSYHWLSESSKESIFEGLRTPFLALIVRSGASIQNQVSIVSPLKTGCYKLIVTLVKENVCWFETHGFNAMELKIKVV